MQSIVINAETIKAFNALPRQPRAPSGLVKNHWHFDLRYVYLEPPSHLLFIIQPESEFVHSERLPLNNRQQTGPESSGLAYFPETGSAAAPEVAKALIHTFVSALWEPPFGTDTKPHGPWSLSTEDAELARAVEREFRRLGVREELCKIRTLSPQQSNSDSSFKRFWDLMTRGMGIADIGRMALQPPDPICFNVIQTGSWDEPPKNDLFQNALDHSRDIINSRPPGRIPNSQMSGAMVEEAKATYAMLMNSKVETVRREADDGKASAAIDYALRLRYSIGVKSSRDLYRYYLFKVILSDTATKKEKSQAHALMIDWYLKGTKKVTARYLFAAAHHANQSALLAKPACPTVMLFASLVLEPNSHTVLALCAQYHAVWDAMDKRNKEIERENKQAEKKRGLKSNRYICAAQSCYIQASKGQVLSRCSGKCDPDKKPYYCSQECQKADWKNHKPFCKSGAECSILEKDMDLPATTVKGENTLSVPVRGPDGKITMLSSSTMGPEMLKEFHALSFSNDPASLASSSTTKHVEHIETIVSSPPAGPATRSGIEEVD